MKDPRQRKISRKNSTSSEVSMSEMRRNDPGVGNYDPDTARNLQYVETLVSMGVSLYLFPWWALVFLSYLFLWWAWVFLSYFFLFEPSYLFFLWAFVFLSYLFLRWAFIFLSIMFRGSNVCFSAIIKYLFWNNICFASCPRCLLIWCQYWRGRLPLTWWVGPIMPRCHDTMVWKGFRHHGVEGFQTPWCGRVSGLNWAYRMLDDWKFPVWSYQVFRFFFSQMEKCYSTNFFQKWSYWHERCEMC